jgi:chemotaxis protein CheX
MDTITDADHLDLVGEIANMFSGRARKELGEGLEISVPRRAAGIAFKPSSEPRPYVVPLSWHGFDAMVVVDLKTGRQ